MTWFPGDGRGDQLSLTESKGGGGEYRKFTAAEDI